MLGGSAAIVEQLHLPHLREIVESDDGRLFRPVRVSVRVARSRSRSNEPSPIAIILDAKLRQAKPNCQAYAHSAAGAACLNFGKLECGRSRIYIIYISLM